MDENLSIWIKEIRKAHSVCLMRKKPIAILFNNGNAIYTNTKGNQITKMQQFGWSGLHLFHKKYPKESDIFLNNNPLPVLKECVEYILKYIKEPSKFV